MDPYPIPPFPPDVAPDPAVNIITNPGAAENIDNLNILTAATVQQGQHLPPTSVPPAAHSHSSAAAVVVATHTHHHHQHGAVHHARLRSSIEDSPPSLRFMADTVPAQVVDTSVISSASASPKLIVQTDYPVSATIDTEVTYTPSPRRMGKKKVKLNPLKRPSNEERRGSAKLTHEANYGLVGGYDKNGLQRYDKTLPIVPIAGEDPFGANVNVIIGGKKIRKHRNVVYKFSRNLAAI